MCKQRTLMYSPAVAGNIIISCFVLNNIMIESRYPLPPEADIDAQIDDNNNEFYDIAEHGAMNALHIREA